MKTIPVPHVDALAEEWLSQAAATAQAEHQLAKLIRAVDQFLDAPPQDRLTAWTHLEDTLATAKAHLA